MGEVSDGLGIQRTNFTQIIRKLEDRGLLARTRDAHDRRAFGLRLTEEGLRLVSSMQEEFELRNSYVAAAMTPQVREDLGRGLRAVRELVSAMKAGRPYTRR